MLSDTVVNDLLNLLEGIKEGLENVGSELRLMRKSLDNQSLTRLVDDSRKYFKNDT